MNSKLLVLVAVIAGVLFLAISVVYFIEPAKSLPGFFPGFDSTMTKTHFKHGIGALFLGLASLALAWFKSNKKSSKKE